MTPEEVRHFHEKNNRSTCKVIGVGEKIDEFEIFHPDCLASRILGMGDVVSLVEKAQEHLDEEESANVENTKAEFDFEDFLSQMKQMKMGQ